MFPFTFPKDRPFEEWIREKWGRCEHTKERGFEEDTNKEDSFVWAQWLYARRMVEIRGGQKPVQGREIVGNRDKYQIHTHLKSATSRCCAWSGGKKEIISDARKVLLDTLACSEDVSNTFGETSTRY